MNESLSVADVMRRDYVGVNEGDSVAGAAELIHEEGVGSALVLRGREPVGVLTSRGVVEVVASGADPDELSVEDAMREPAVTIDREADLAEAIGTIVDRGVRQLAVVDGEGAVGVVSEHDIVTAPTVLSAASHGSDATSQAPIENRPEGEPRTEARSTQGVCEGCGALAGSLDAHNGRLLCADCLAAAP